MPASSQPRAHKIAHACRHQPLRGLGGLTLPTRNLRCARQRCGGNIAPSGGAAQPRRSWAISRHQIQSGWLGYRCAAHRRRSWVADEGERVPVISHAERTLSHRVVGGRRARGLAAGGRAEDVDALSVPPLLGPAPRVRGEHVVRARSAGAEAGLACACYGDATRAAASARSAARAWRSCTFCSRPSGLPPA